jgi:hypothetical protein
MLSLYLARIEDLRHDDFVKIDRAACHHVALPTAGALLKLGLSPVATRLHLRTRVRCAGGGARGRADVSVKYNRKSGGAGERRSRRPLSPVQTRDTATD